MPGHRLPDRDLCWTACDLCWSLVPPSLMPFHRMWHDALQRGSADLFRQDEVDKLVSVVSAIKAVPKKEATARFTESLRERLLAEALDMALAEEESLTSTGEGKAPSGQKLRSTTEGQSGGF